MAHAHSNSQNNRAAATISESEVKPTTFHDFLGDKGQPQDSAPSATSDLGSGEEESFTCYPFLFLPFCLCLLGFEFYYQFVLF